MTDEVYLFDSKLRGAIEDLIKEAKNKLVIISPYIDLSPTVISALKGQLERNDKNFELKILFGKNGKSELRLGKKPKLKKSLEFFMQFPNVEIRFEELLHAKFYFNDYHLLFSSMNLYDYSEARNIEFGVLEAYASKGLMGKALEMADVAVTGAVEKVSKKMMGGNDSVDPIEKFEKIFNESELLYKTEPVLEAKTGVFASLAGVVGKELKKVTGKKVVLDILSDILGVRKKVNETSFLGFKQESKRKVKLVSATTLGKEEGLTYKQVVAALHQKGYIDENANNPTKNGEIKGIVLKETEKGSWLVYPESLAYEL